MKAGFKRVVEVARCCGLKYFKARLFGRAFPDSHALACCRCGMDLIYAKPNLRVTKNALAKKMRAARVAAGLTTKGSVPIRRFRYELAGLHGAARHAAYMTLQRADRKRAGLTARGSVPVFVRRGPSLAMQTFAALKADIAQQPNVVPIYQGFSDRPVKGNLPSANSLGFMRNLIARRVS